MIDYTPTDEAGKLGWVAEECGEVLAAMCNSEDCDSKEAVECEVVLAFDGPPDHNAPRLVSVTVDNEPEMVAWEPHGPHVRAWLGGVFVVLDGAPMGRFIEIEDAAGQSVSVGTWADRGDSWTLTWRASRQKLRVEQLS